MFTTELCRGFFVIIHLKMNSHLNLHAKMHLLLHKKFSDFPPLACTLRIASRGLHKFGSPLKM